MSDDPLAPLLSRLRARAIEITTSSTPLPDAYEAAAVAVGAALAEDSPAADLAASAERLAAAALLLALAAHGENLVEAVTAGTDEQFRQTARALVDTHRVLERVHRRLAAALGVGDSRPDLDELLDEVVDVVRAARRAAARPEERRPTEGADLLAEFRERARAFRKPG